MKHIKLRDLDVSRIGLGAMGMFGRLDNGVADANHGGVIALSIS